MKFINYVKESFGEIKHVKWPSRREAIIFTLAIIVISFAVAYYLGLFDYIFSNLLKRFI